MDVRPGLRVARSGALARATTGKEPTRPFFRALELDPRFTPAYLHPIDTGFSLDDGARTTDLLGRIREHARGSEDDVVFGTDFALAFGSPDVRAAAVEALDTLFHATVDDAIAEGDSFGAASLEATADALEAYATWRRGDATRAWPLLESAQKRVTDPRGARPPRGPDIGCSRFLRDRGIPA